MLHPGDPLAAGQWADGQLLRILHGRAKAVAATLASVAAKTRANPRTRHLDLTGMDKAVTYLTNNHQHMRYDKALEKGWPIATGRIEGACRFVIEDRFEITGARWSPDGAEDILKLRAVVINGDPGDYMRYYKERYRDEHHLARYDPPPSSTSASPHDQNTRKYTPLRKTHPSVLPIRRSRLRRRRSGLLVRGTGRSRVLWRGSVVPGAVEIRGLTTDRHLRSRLHRGQAQGP